MNIFDRAAREVLGTRTTQLLPGWAGIYAGARLSRLEDDWFTALLSGNEEIKRSLRTLRARSRQLFRDNPMAAAFGNLVMNNVVGPHGITLQSVVRTKAGDAFAALNGTIEDAFADWTQPEYASVDGRLAWEDLQRLAAWNWAQDGEFLFRLRAGAQNPYAFSLQVIDPDQLDETYNNLTLPGGVQIRMGVEVNADGRPLAYWLWDHHPSEWGWTRNRVRVPADQIIHGFVTTRPGQVRGVPPLAPVMLSLKHLDGLIESELVASRTAANKAVLYEQDPEAVAEGTGLPGGTLVDELAPGSTNLLPPGIKAVTFDPQHPTTAFPDFVKSILRGIAAGIGVSYVALTNDLESTSFSSGRIGLSQERDVWRALQQWLIRRLHTPVYREWMRWSAAAGALALPTPEAGRWAVPHWDVRGWDSVNPLQDREADQLAVLLGVKSRREICAEHGQDIDKVFEDLAAEKAQADALGLDISGGKVMPQIAQPFPGDGNGGHGDGPGSAGAAGDALPDDGAGGGGADGGGRGRGGRPDPRRTLVRIAR